MFGLGWKVGTSIMAKQTLQINHDLIKSHTTFNVSTRDENIRSAWNDEDTVMLHTFSKCELKSELLLGWLVSQHALCEWLKDIFNMLDTVWKILMNKNHQQ